MYLTYTPMTTIMDTNGKILAAVAAGIAAGAILFAPDKGSKSWRKINEKDKKFADDIYDKIRKGKETFNDLKADVERKVNDTAEEFS